MTVKKRMRKLAKCLALLEELTNDGMNMVEIQQKITERVDWLIGDNFEDQEKAQRLFKSMMEKK